MVARLHVPPRDPMHPTTYTDAIDADVTLIDDLRRVITSADADAARGPAEWGQRAVQWTRDHMPHILHQGVKNGESVTRLGCKILTEILEHHQNHPSQCVSEFVHHTILPVLINCLSTDTVSMDAAYKGLLVATLQIMGTRYRTV